MGCLKSLFINGILLTGVIVVIVQIVLATSTAGQNGGRNVPMAQKRTVILQAPATTGQVQMFDRISVDASVMAVLNDGTSCRVLVDKIKVQVEGLTMYFWKLRCQGHDGYVNDRWVAP